MGVKDEATGFEKYADEVTRLDRIRFAATVMLPDASGAERGTTVFIADAKLDAEACRVGDTVVIRVREHVALVPWSTVASARPASSDASRWLARAALSNGSARLPNVSMMAENNRAAAAASLTEV